jgi:nucleotide-binding universal stress UspA family protein
MTASPPVQSILVAIDGSKAQPIVFRTAATMARDLRAQLFLVHVLSVPPEIPPGAHTRPDHVEETLEAVTRGSLRALMADASGVSFGPPIVVEGEPWRAILDVARDLDVDLIVMGSHRYHGLDRVLGTVAAKVVNHADRNVLVVRDKAVANG